MSKIKYPKGRDPNSLKNLKPIKPGEIRNPVGKLKGTKDKITLIRNCILDGFNPFEFKKWKLTEQTEFMRILVKLMPQELKIDAGISLPDDDPKVLEDKIKTAMIRLGYSKDKDKN